jgi:hypothetical protein
MSGQSAGQMRGCVRIDAWTDVGTAGDAPTKASNKQHEQPTAPCTDAAPPANRARDGTAYRRHARTMHASAPAPRNKPEWCKEFRRHGKSCRMRDHTAALWHRGIGSSPLPPGTLRRGLRTEIDTHWRMQGKQQEKATKQSEVAVGRDAKRVQWGRAPDDCPTQRLECVCVGGGGLAHLFMAFHFLLVTTRQNPTFRNQTRCTGHIAAAPGALVSTRLQCTSAALEREIDGEIGDR